MTANNFLPGWNEDRVRQVLAHYDAQTPKEAVLEDESAYEAITQTLMAVPVDLVPAVRDLIAGQVQG